MRLTRDAVEKAVIECDELGREEFLRRYGFREAHKYFLEIDGRRYDVKAIAGAAHSHANLEDRPLGSGDFNSIQARSALRSLGFSVVTGTESYRDLDANHIEAFRQARMYSKWAEMPPDVRATLREAHEILDETGTEVAASLSDGHSYVRTLTSGFTPASGIRGYVPKDLWVAVTRRDLADELLGMPQLYVILSDRGIEVGFAAAIHPRDFSNASLKEKLRGVVPKLFPTLPEASSELVSRIDADLQAMGAWRPVKKARQDFTERGDFASLSDLFRFLHSPRGESWGAGGVCRFLSPDHSPSGVGAREAFTDLAGVFAPLFEALPPAREILENTSAREPTSDSQEVSEALETFLSVLNEARSQRPFREYDDLSSVQRQRPWDI